MSCFSPLGPQLQPCCYHLNCARFSGCVPFTQTPLQCPPKLWDNVHLFFRCDLEQLKGPMIYNSVKKVYHERMPSQAHWQGPDPVFPSPIHMSLPCSFLHLSHWLPPPPHSSSMCLSALPSLPLPSHPLHDAAAGLEQEVMKMSFVPRRL